jgi:hypothetical protein
MEINNQWRNKVLILGGLSGLVLGILTAFLFIKTRPDGIRNKITSKEKMKIGFNLASMIKQIIEIGK